MSLHKAIAHLKEHRKEWRGSKSVDGTCRNNRGCPWCFGNRMAQRMRLELAAKDEIKLAADEVTECDKTLGVEGW